MQRYCCSECFSDIAVKELIVREAQFGDCYFCNAEQVLVIQPNMLNGLFELALSCVHETDTGAHLSVVYCDELKIVSERVNKPIELLDSILGESLTAKSYELVESLLEYKGLWGEFKKHLINENRFFPKSSLYGQIFTSGQNHPSSEALAFLNAVDSLSRDKHKGSEFYRARISGTPLSAEDMGSPPKELATAGRANPVGIPYLYLSEDEETCFREIKPSNGATIYLSKVIAKSDLKLIDLTNPKHRVALLKFEESEIKTILKCIHLLEEFAMELSVPVLPEKSHLDYIPTQFICEFLRTIKVYDGLIFNSSYGDGKNVVLFSEGKVEITEPVEKLVCAIDIKVR
ncbi:RES family NAD+ phosphorylase [Vibrio parahaemolyticus]|uniref:RES family NAD+ phosphorylase n=1 Tax=Vibrio parahaemolyticus TaxID=670 RepID=UPI00249173DB|nr:RES family NAD+ phosphorylase [Vibrio parahaemolyticus]